MHTPRHLQTILSTAIRSRNLKHGVQIHAQIIRNSNDLSDLQLQPILHTHLINMYAKCGRPDKSLLLLSTADENCNDVVTYTSLITHFSQTGKPFEALSLFQQLRRRGLQPNHFTFSAILCACAATGEVVHGDQTHGLLRKVGGFESNVFVGSALTDTYAKCGDLWSAKRMFDEMPERNIVSWNALIVGFLNNGFPDKSIEIFRGLVVEEAAVPNQVTFSSVLSACARMCSSDFGRQVHALAEKLGQGRLAYVQNSLLDMYCKCRPLEEALEVFCGLEDGDVVSWNVMATECIENGRLEEACCYFWAMRREGFYPDEASFTMVLRASAGLAAIDHGTSIHNQIIKSGFMRYPCVGSSLITLYAKCGSLDEARQVFEEIKGCWTVSSWTAIIAAFQLHGRGNRVVELFDEMLGDGIEPNHITFVCVLSACSHGGLVEKGFQYLKSMSPIHGIEPGSEHYSCLVDMLGRAGRLEEAKEFIDKMPVKPNASGWGALLSACTTYGNLELGREAAHRLFEIEPDNSGNYVLLSHLYTRHGMPEEAKQARELMGLSGVRKRLGGSLTDSKNVNCV